MRSILDLEAPSLPEGASLSAYLGRQRVLWQEKPLPKEVFLRGGFATPVQPKDVVNACGEGLSTPSPRNSTTTS